MIKFLVKLGLVLWLAGWSVFGIIQVGYGPHWWPSCGPRYRVMEQTYGGRRVYWLRKTGGAWPLCDYVLQRGAYDTLDDALAEARSRLRSPDTDEVEAGSVR